MPGTPKEERKKMYDLLKSEKEYDGDSFEDFEADFGTAEGQKMLFDHVSKKGLYTKKYEDFVGKYYADVNQEQVTEKKKEQKAAIQEEVGGGWFDVGLPEESTPKDSPKPATILMDPKKAAAQIVNSNEKINSESLNELSKRMGAAFGTNEVWDNNVKNAEKKLNTELSVLEERKAAGDIKDEAIYKKLVEKSQKKHDNTVKVAQDAKLYERKLSNEGIAPPTYLALETLKTMQPEEEWVDKPISDKLFHQIDEMSKKDGSYLSLDLPERADPSMMIIPFSRSAPLADNVDKVLDAEGFTGTERSAMRLHLLQRLVNQPRIDKIETKLAKSLKKLGMPSPAEFEKEASIIQDIQNNVNNQVVKYRANWENQGKVLDDAFKVKSDSYKEQKTLELEGLVAAYQTAFEKGEVSDKVANEAIKKKQEEINAEFKTMYDDYIVKRSAIQEQSAVEYGNIHKLNEESVAKIAKFKEKYKLVDGKFSEEYKEKYQAVVESVWEEQDLIDKSAQADAWNKMNYLQKFETSLQGGFMNLAEMGFGGWKYFAPGAEMPDIGLIDIDIARKNAPAPDLGDFNLHHLYSPDWWVKNLGEQLPIMLPLMGTGGAVMKGVTLGLGTKGATSALSNVLGKYGQLTLQTRQAIGSVFGGGASRYIESYMEGSLTFTESLKDGKSWEESMKNFQTVRDSNLMLMGLDAMQMYMTFAKGPKIMASKAPYSGIPKGLKNAYSFGGKMGIMIFSEGKEEQLQEWFQARVNNPYLSFGAFANSEAGKEVFWVGGMMGVGTSAMFGGFRDRSAIGMINKQVQSYYSMMDSGDVSLDEVENRLHQLGSTIETLKAQGVLSDKEIGNAQEILAHSGRMFNQVYNGILPFEYDSPQFNEYSALTWEHEQLRKKAEQYDKAVPNEDTAVEKELIKSQQENINDRIMEIVSDPKASSYGVDDMPLTKTEFESLVFDPANREALDQGRLTTNDPEILARMRSEGIKEEMFLGNAENVMTELTGSTDFSMENVDDSIMIAEDKLAIAKEEAAKNENSSKYPKFLNAERDAQRNLDDLKYYKGHLEEQQSILDKGVIQTEYTPITNTQDLLDTKKDDVFEGPDGKQWTVVNNSEGRGMMKSEDGKYKVFTASEESIKELEGFRRVSEVAAVTPVVKEDITPAKEEGVVVPEGDGEVILENEDGTPSVTAYTSEENGVTTTRIESEPNKHGHKGMDWFNGELFVKDYGVPEAEILNQLPGAEAISDVNSVVVSEEKIDADGNKSVRITGRYENLNTGTMEDFDIEVPVANLNYTLTPEQKKLIGETIAKAKVEPTPAKEKAPVVEEKTEGEPTTEAKVEPVKEKKGVINVNAPNEQGKLNNKEVNLDVSDENSMYEIFNSIGDNAEIDITRDPKKLDRMLGMPKEFMLGAIENPPKSSVKTGEDLLNNYEIIPGKVKKAGQGYKVTQKIKLVPKQGKSVVTPITETKVEPEPIIEEEEDVEGELQDTPINAAEDVKRGYRVVGGIRYDRPAVIEDMHTGDEIGVRFGPNDKVQAKFAVMEASDVEQSHMKTMPNPKFFVNQPKGRGHGDFMKITGTIKAMALDNEALAYSANAYFGPPVVNTRGEVLQGNGRTEGIKIAYNEYGSNAASYKQYLIDNAAKFGLDPDVIAKMERPMMVRVIDVTDDAGKKLSSFKSSDLEDQGGAKSEAISMVRKVTPEQLDSIISAFEGRLDASKSLKEIVMNIKIINALHKAGAISDQDYSSGVTGSVVSSELADKAVSFFKQLVLEGGIPDLAFHLDQLPFYIMDGIERSTVSLLSTNPLRDIMPDLHIAILGVRDYLFGRKSQNLGKSQTIEDWLNILESDGSTKRDQYTPVELALIEFMVDKTAKQKEIAKLFADYKTAVEPIVGDMFTESFDGISKVEAINQILGTNIDENENRRKELELSRTGETATGVPSKTESTEATTGESGESVSKQPTTTEQERQIDRDESEVEPSEMEMSDVFAEFDRLINSGVDHVIAMDTAMSLAENSGLSAEALEEIEDILEQDVKLEKIKKGVTEKASEIEIELSEDVTPAKVEELAEENDKLLDEAILPTELNDALIDQLSQGGLISIDDAHYAKKHLKEPNEITQDFYDLALSKLPEFAEKQKTSKKAKAERAKAEKVTGKKKTKPTEEKAEKPKNAKEKNTQLDKKLDIAKTKLQDLLDKLKNNDKSQKSGGPTIGEVRMAAMTYGALYADKIAEIHADNPEKINKANWRQGMIDTFGDIISPYLDMILGMTTPPSVHNDTPILSDHIANLRKIAKGKEVVINTETPAPEGKQGKPKVDERVGNERPPITYVNYEKLPSSVDEFIPESRYGTELDKHQRFAVNMALTNFLSNGKRGFLLLDSMGVGKTRQIIATAIEYAKRTGKKVVIVTQNQQIIDTAFMPDALAMGIDLSKENVELITYTQLEKASKNQYGLVIYDESQNLKNPSKRFEASGAIVSTHVMYSTATPGDNIGNAIYFLSDLLGISREEMMGELGITKTKEGTWELRANKSELDAITAINDYIQKSFEDGQIIRREYPYWGTIGEDIIPIDSDQELEIEGINAAYDEQIDKTRPNQTFYDGKTGQMKNSGKGRRGWDNRYKGLSDDAANVLDDDIIRSLREQKINMLDKLVETYKVKAAVLRIKANLAEGKAVVVTSQNVNELNIKGLNGDMTTTEKRQSFLQELAKALDKAGIPYVEINAKTDKSKAVEDFQSGKVNVVIGSMQSMSTGINLDDVTGDKPRVLYVASASYDANAFNQVQGRISRRNTKTPAETNILYGNTASETTKRGKVERKTGVLGVFQGAGLDADSAKEIEENDKLRKGKALDRKKPYIETFEVKGSIVSGGFILVKDSFDIKNLLKNIGAKPHTKWEKQSDGTNKKVFQGWEFPISRKAEIEELVEKYNAGELDINYARNSKANFQFSTMAGTNANRQVNATAPKGGTGTAPRIDVSVITGKKPKPIREIIGDVRRAFTVYMKYGKYQPGSRAAGSYQAVNSAIHAATPNDIDVIAHELGHLLDDRLKISPMDDALDTELMDYWAYGSAAPASHPNPQQYIRSEGIAEYIRAMIYNPAEAKSRSPILWDLVMNKLSEAEIKALETFSEDVRTLHGADILDQMAATMQETEADRKARSNAYQNKKRAWDNMMRRFGFKSDGMSNFNITWWDKLNRNWADKYAPFKKSMRELQKINGVTEQDILPEDNPYTLARLFSGLGSKIKNMFQQGVVTIGKDGLGYSRLTDLSDISKQTYFNNVKKGDIVQKGDDSYTVVEVEKKPGTKDSVKITAFKNYGKDVDSSKSIEIVFGSKEATEYKKQSPITMDWLLAPIQLAINGKSSKYGAVSFKGKNVAIRDFKDYVGFYMVAERTIELANRFNREDVLTGIGIGMTDLDAAQKFLDKFETEGPAFQEQVQEAARRYRIFADSMLRYMLDSGRISQEQIDLIKANNLQYVAMQRVQDMNPGEDFDFIESSGGGQFSLDKAVKGSKRDRFDPYENLMTNFHKVVESSDLNQIYNAYVDLMRNDRSMYEGDVTPTADIGRQIHITPTTDISNRPIIIVYNKGVKEYWELDQDVYDSIQLISRSIQYSDVVKLLLKITGVYTKVLRGTVTKSPIFAYLRNLPRDIQARWVQSRTAGKADIAGFREHYLKLGLDENTVEGLIKDLNKSKKETISNFELYGGDQAGYYTKSREHYYAAMDVAIRKMAKEGKIVIDSQTLSEVWDNYDNWLAKGERSTRVAEYKSAFKYAKTKLKYDDYNASLYAAFQARDLMDFAVVGVHMDFFNKIIPFSNASLQGTLRTIKAFKENPKGTLLKWMLINGAPHALFMALSMLGDYEDEYDELPAYQKDMFYNFKIPQLSKDLWFTIPKPFELGITGTAFERMATMIKNGETFDKAFQGYNGSLYRAMIPFAPEDMLGPFKAINEATSNYSAFYQSSIIPGYEEPLAVGMRKGTSKASNLGKVIGSVMGFGGEGVDPRKVDYVIKNWFSYFGDLAMKTSDLFPSGEEGDTGSNDFNSGMLGVLKDRNPGKMRSVQYMYDNMGKYKLWDTKDGEGLKAQLGGMNDLNTGEARDEQTKLIIEYSRNIEKKWKANIPIYDKFLLGKDVEINGKIYNKKNTHHAKRVRHFLFNN